MKFALSLLLALPLVAQTFPCKGSFLGSASMRGIYGGKTTIFQLHVICRNVSVLPSQPITGALIPMAMPTINTMPDGVSSVLLAQTWANQPSQKFSRDATLGLGVLGALEGAGGKLALIGAGPFGWIVAGVVTGTQYLIQYFTKTMPLNVANLCGDIGVKPTPGGIIVQPGQTLECDTFVSKPPKLAAPLPATVNFDLLTGWMLTPAPPIPPVQLQRPLMLQPQPRQTKAPALPHELDAAYIKSHPTEADPYYQPHPAGYWQTDKPQILLAKGQ